MPFVDGDEAEIGAVSGEETRHVGVGQGANSQRWTKLGAGRHETRQHPAPCLGMSVREGEQMSASDEVGIEKVDRCRLIARCSIYSGLPRLRHSR